MHSKNLQKKKRKKEEEVRSDLRWLYKLNPSAWPSSFFFSIYNGLHVKK